jgi:hypothetical protein
MDGSMTDEPEMIEDAPEPPKNKGGRPRKVIDNPCPCGDKPETECLGCEKHPITDHWKG